VGFEAEVMKWHDTPPPLVLAVVQLDELPPVATPIGTLVHAYAAIMLAELVVSGLHCGPGEHELVDRVRARCWTTCDALSTLIDATPMRVQGMRVRKKRLHLVRMPSGELTTADAKGLLRTLANRTYHPLSILVEDQRAARGLRFHAAEALKTVGLVWKLGALPLPRS
jgi:hypothetical protein